MQETQLTRRSFAAVKPLCVETLSLTLTRTDFLALPFGSLTYHSEQTHEEEPSANFALTPLPCRADFRGTLLLVSWMPVNRTRARNEILRRC